MARLVWDQTADSRYEYGVDRGVFYPRVGIAEVWNGLTAVQESPSDADEKVRYIEGIPSRNRRPGSFGGTIEAFTYPEGLFPNKMVQKAQRGFGFSYRVMTEYSYKIHMVYNVLLGPTSHSYEQEGTAPFSWDFTTVPVAIPDGRPAAHLIVDASLAYPAALAAFEDVLYGSDETLPQLPLPSELFKIFSDNALLQVIDLGDGLWQIVGPDDAVFSTAPTQWTISWPSVVAVSDHTYQISSF